MLFHSILFGKSLTKHDGFQLITDGPFVSFAKSGRGSLLFKKYMKNTQWVQNESFIK